MFKWMMISRGVGGLAVQRLAKFSGLRLTPDIWRRGSFPPASISRRSRRRFTRRRICHGLS